MSANISDFKEIFPEFADVPDARVNFFLSGATTQISADVFESQTDNAIYFMTAHNLVMNSPEKAGNPTITSERVGEVSVTYQAGYVVKPQDGYFQQTQYGLQYLQLRNSCVITTQVL